VLERHAKVQLQSESSQCRVIWISCDKYHVPIYIHRECHNRVVGEIQEINFTASRRLQLVVEQSAVTGFILRHQPRNLNTNAFVSRWKISPVPSAPEDDLPGVGFPRWNVELQKIRNGKPGTWQVQYFEGKFHPSTSIASIPAEHMRKTG